MSEPYPIIKRNLSYEKTVDIQKIKGAKVLSKGGKVIGRVAEIRINPHTTQPQGVLVKRGLGEIPLYIGRSYFAHLSYESIILNMEPSILIKGKRVITTQGKILGTVREVIRKEKTNDVTGIIVKSPLTRKALIPHSEIKLIGKSNR